MLLDNIDPDFFGFNAIEIVIKWHIIEKAPETSMIVADAPIPNWTLTIARQGQWSIWMTLMMAAVC